MQPKTTLVLLLLVLGLGAYIFWVDRAAETTRSREEQARQALRLDPARITGFTLVASNLQVTCAQRNGLWQVVRPIAARADTAAVDRLLAGLASLPRGEVITGAERRARRLTLAAYGLDPARVRLVLDYGTRRQTVLVGRAAPLGDALYLKDADRDEVVATTAEATNLFPVALADLRDRTLFRGSPEAVRRIEWRSNGRYVQLAKNEQGDWMFLQPLVARADRAAMQHILGWLFDWKVEEFVGDQVADFAPYGLDENATRVVLNPGSPTDEQTLLLGKHTSTNAPRLFAARPPEKAVFAVAVDPLVKLMLKLDELRDRRLFTLSAGDLGGLRLQQGQRILDLKLEADGWRLQQPRQARADAQRVQAFLEQVTGARIEAFLDDLATRPEALGTGASVWKLTLERRPAGGVPAKTGASGEDQQVLLINATPRPGGRCLVKLEHEAAPYEVAGSWVTQLRVDPLAFRSREILQLDPGDLLKLQMVSQDKTQAVERASATNDFLAVLPARGTPPPRFMQQLVLAVSRLTAVRLVADDNGDLAKYGLAQPTLTLTLGLKSEAGLAKTLLIGAPTPEGCYAMVRGQDLVFVMDPAVSALLGRDWLQPDDAPSPAEQKETPGAPPTNRPIGSP